MEFTYLPLLNILSGLFLRFFTSSPLRIGVFSMTMLVLLGLFLTSYIGRDNRALHYAALGLQLYVSAC